jgi:putative transposase
VIQRSFRYRLRPTPEQAETLAQYAGATRFIYNLALEQRRDFWRQYRAQTGGWLNFISQGREVTQLRAEVPWLAAIPSTPLTQAHIALSCEIEHEAAANDLPAIGIDRGIANTLALSSGEMLSTAGLMVLERRRRRAQRVLARRTRGSDRYRKQRARLGRICAKIARSRTDWRHKATLNLSQRFGTIVVEALPVKSMTRSGRGKRGLNRSILEQGWSAFESTLTYKLEERGGTLVKVNPAFTSQECSTCGVIDKASRESQARFACRSCGFAIHADTNAAVNILRRGTAAMLVEGRGCAPVEARTINLAA